MKFYKCKKCGKIIMQLVSKKTETICCGEAMGELNVNDLSSGGSFEKHMPVYSWIENSFIVEIGRDTHPMVDEHHIMFIAVETLSGFMVHYLSPGNEPITKFALSEDPIRVYEYCNLHGLWMLDISNKKDF